jgi:hypothetical protein
MKGAYSDIAGRKDIRDCFVCSLWTSREVGTKALLARVAFLSLAGNVDRVKRFAGS